MTAKKSFTEKIKENVISYIVIGVLSFLLAQFTNYVTTSNRISVIETKIDNLTETVENINMKIGTTDANVAGVKAQVSRIEGQVSILIRNR